MRSIRLTALRERAAEVAAIRKARKSAAQQAHGSILLIEGHAGIGKTRLLEVAEEDAAANGVGVVRGRGFDLERDFAFGVVRQLFEGLLNQMTKRERGRVLAGAAALAAPLFALATSDAAMEGPVAQGALLHGLYWLTANLSERSPLAIVVDDAHWCDAPSLRFLSFLGHRIEGLPLMAVLAARPTEPGPQRALLEALKDEPGVTTLRPAPLSEAGVAELVRAQLKNADDHFCDACHAASGGNPFLLSELLLEVEAQGIEPTDDQADRLSRLAPENVRRSVVSRTGRISPQATALARAASVLENGRLIDAADLGAVSFDEATELADGLASAGIFGSLDPLRFAHPLLHSAVYVDIPEAERALMHARAAELLRRRGAPVDDIAAQIQRAPPFDERWVTDLLFTAAEQARARGAPDVCARYLLRLLDEPLQHRRRFDVLLALGQAEALAGIPQALDHLQEVYELAPSPEQRAEAALTISRAHGWAGETQRAVELLAHAADELAVTAPEQARRLEVELLVVADVDLSVRPVAADRIARAESVPPEQDGPLALMLLAHRAVDLLRSGDSATEAADIAERALQSEALFQLGMAGSHHFFLTTYVLICADRLDAARAPLDRALSEARTRGSAVAFTLASSMRSQLHVRAGELDDAEADGRSAVDVARLNGLTVGELMSNSILLLSLVERDLETAREIERAMATQFASMAHVQTAVLLLVRGRLRLQLGDMEHAAADLCEGGARFSSWGMRNPGSWDWRSLAAQAFGSMGDRSRALELAHEELELARTWGTPRAIGIALRALGLVEGGGTGIEHLREAVAVLEGSVSRLEHARALTDLGAALRRSNLRSEAREPLRQGLDMARASGATVLAERAAEELAAAGARPRRERLSGVEALTPTERRIASLAAEGRSNPEIAQSLFVTRKTVEFHLSNAYRKLGIGARGDLPVALNPRDPPR